MMANKLKSVEMARRSSLELLRNYVDCFQKMKVTLREIYKYIKFIMRDKMEMYAILIYLYNFFVYIF